jgi:endo-1,4-beta-xylanase
MLIRLKKQISLIAAAMLLITSLSFGGPPLKVTAEANTATFDFEDGTSQGWYSRGDTILATKEAQHGGAYALLSSGRTANWNGPGYNLQGVMTPGNVYEVEAYIRLADGESDTTANMTVQRTSGGAENYDSLVFKTPVTSGAWTKLSAQYTLSGDVSALSLYFELPESLASFYVDDITVTPIQINSPEQLVTDFEDGTVQGWNGRGGVEVLSASAAAAHTGSFGLSVDGRTQGWNGPQHDVTPLMIVGKTYTISAWLRLPEGTPDAAVSMTIQRTAGGTNNYEGIGTAAVKAGSWVKLEGEYKLASAADTVSVYFEASANPTLPFYVDDFLIRRNSDQEPVVIEDGIPSLKDIYANYFRLGTAFTVPEIADPNGPDAQLIKKHFNSVTPGNELKWDATEPQDGQFNFTRSDSAVQFAVDNGIAVRGHTLVWHSQTPDWVFHDADGNLAGKELLLQRLKRHIDTVVGRYKGKMYAWDVVNEVIDPSQPGGMRNSLWYQIAGEEFIEKAFIYAHEADPGAKLFINDYNTHDALKRQYLHDLIKRLKAKGIPVDGVGHQMHINIQSPSVQVMEDSINTFTDLGIEQQITEMDMSSYTNDADSWNSFPSELALKQAYRYRDIFEMFKRHKDQITAVIFWGKDDANSWLRSFPVTRKNWPLLFDERLRAKPAYWGVADPSKLPVEIQRVNAAQGKADIDGQTEEVWDPAPVAPILKNGETAAKFKAIWNTDRLYLTVDVLDSSVNGNDSVELFIDGNNGKTTSYEADDKHYEFRRSGANPDKSASYKTKKLDGGYRIEASVPLQGASLGKEIGFDLRLRDRNGENLTLLSWNDATGSQDTDTSKFGILTLGEGSRLTEATRGTAIIDGVIDAAWKDAKEIVTDRWVAGTSGSKAKVRTLWNNGKLYVLAEVADTLLSKQSPNVWEQDSIEIFIDRNNAKTDYFEADDGQYRINFDNEVSLNPVSLQGTLVSATKRTAVGYVVEAEIALPGGPPIAGDIIGFDMQVNNDEDGNGSRDSVAIWNDTSGQSFQSTSSYGLLKCIDTASAVQQ